MFGIHIGNTNASIAYCKENGNAEVITNEGGDRMTPAVVALIDNEILVGTAAKAAQVSNMKTTITGNKSLMGRGTQNYTKYHNNIETEVKNDEINYCISLGEKIRYLTPQNIAKFIFKELLVTAKSALCVDTSNLPCVLLMPRSFPGDYCEKYKQAAEAAGWRVLQIINEAAAAVLTHSLLQSKSELPQTVIVYRLGGTTCEITGCEIYDGMMTILGSTHRDDLGGNLFVHALTEFLAEEFFRKYKLDPRENRRSVGKLSQASQNCIHVLSNLPASNFFIESLHEGIDFTVTLSRARFELLIKTLLERCIEPLKSLLDELELNGSVDKVILCGGAANIPSFKQCISTIFDATKTEILTNKPEEVLAVGAAKQAYYLSCYDCQDILPRSMDISLDTTDLTYETFF